MVKVSTGIAILILNLWPLLWRKITYLKTRLHVRFRRPISQSTAIWTGIIQLKSFQK